MGWLHARGRRWPREPATFQQTVVIVREVLTTHRATSDVELTEASIDRHLALGFQYDKATIHRAIDALTDPARFRNRTN